MIYITKKVRFSAAHRLFNPEFSDELNNEIYDKCSNFYGHGHNYTMEVTVKGIPDTNTGYLIDLKKMKRILFDELVCKVDHKHLNHDVEFLQGIIPTVENLCMKFWDILKDKFNPAVLYKIKIFETEDSSAEYFGD